MKAQASRAGLLAAIALTVASSASRPTLAEDQGLLQRGEYLALASDCGGCHTAPGRAPMAGGLRISTPLGSIESTNITPSKTHGIGGYSFNQFDLALRRGIRGDSAHLYPAMPYTAYAKLSKADTRALYAYFMQRVRPVEATPPATHLPFPFNVRLSMAVWNLLFLDRRPFAQDPAHDPTWNRGAYLVQGPAHCGACHTSRNWLMAEDPERALGGADIGDWFAPNITSDPVSGIGGWTVDELIDYLRDGHAPGKGQAGGPMAEAVEASLRHLDSGDLRAIAAYLKTSKAIRDPRDLRPSFAWGGPADDLPTIRGMVLPPNLDKMSGPQLYDAYCATCHQAQGQGSFDGRLPPLFHNTALGRRQKNNVVMAILQGVHRSPDVDMPPFAGELSDIQIATLTNYVARRWGDPSGTVTAEQIAEWRRGGAGSPLLILARTIIALVGVGALAAVIWLIARRRRRRAQVLHT